MVVKCCISEVDRTGVTASREGLAGRPWEGRGDSQQVVESSNHDNSGTGARQLTQLKLELKLWPP